MAEDFPSLQQLCYRAVTLKYGLTKEEISNLITEDEPEYPDGFILPHERAEPALNFDLPLPPHWRVDPRAISAYLIDTEVPTLYINDQEHPLISKYFGPHRRWWIHAVNVNNDRLFQGNIRDNIRDFKVAFIAGGTDS